MRIGIKCICTFLCCILIVFISADAYCQKVENHVRSILQLNSGNFSIPEHPLPSGSAYVFSIVRFKDNLYAAVCSPDKVPYLYNVTTGVSISIPHAVPGEYIRGMYNFDDRELLLGSVRKSGGVIYKTQDLSTFTRTLEVTGYGFRSIGYFKGYFVAGTDGPAGKIHVTKDFVHWRLVSVRAQQCNALVTLNDALWLLSNNGVYYTKDLSKFVLSKPRDPDNPQIYAYLVTSDGLYIATSRATTDPAYSKIWFLPGVKGKWRLKATITEMPLIYWMTQAPSARDIIFGGYSKTIYQMDSATGNYWPVYKQEQAATYCHEANHIGTYCGATIIKVEY